MDWVSDAASKRQFEGFAAEASDSLLCTGYLMTGDVRDAEDLVQETFLRVARRGNRAGGYTSNLDQGGLRLSGTVIDVNHFRHLRGEWHAKLVLGFTLDAAGIRAEIASGQFKVIRPTELHGQKAVELQINVPPNNEAPPHVTTARLWVDATTYLPMQQYLRMSNGQQNVTEYTYLPPAHSRESGEIAPGNPGGLHPGAPHPGHWCFAPA